MKHHRTLKTITVAELIDALEDLEPEALVIFSTDYGDYHHTAQALPIKGEIEEGTVSESAYSNSGFQLHQEEEDERSEEGECMDCGKIDEPHETGCRFAQKYLVIR